jgi:hypothetical protein
MSVRRPCIFLILICIVTLSRAEEPSKGGRPTPSELALEINALRTLYYLKATPEQMDAVLKLARETSGSVKKRKKSRLSADYRQLMEQLHEALAEDDEERVESLEDQLEEKTIAESPEIDDSLAITDAARKHAPKLLKMLRASQVAMFLGMHAEQIADPGERLQEALTKVRGWSLADWQDKREAIGEEIALFVAGVDKAKFCKVNDAVIDLLARARTMEAEEHKEQRDQLKLAAEKIVGEAGPTEVLRHFLEFELARMLSNPRLESALQARIEQDK